MKSLLAIALGGILAMAIYGVTFGIAAYWPPWPAVFLLAFIVTSLCIRVVKSWMYDEEEHGVVLLYMLREYDYLQGNQLRKEFESVTGRTLSADRFHAIMDTLEKQGKVSHRDEQDEHGTVRIYKAI